MPTRFNHRTTRRIAAIGLAILAAFGTATAGTPPNIILMVADDLGYGDLGCQGATKISTPRIDSLARDGVRFTDAHSFSGICMPSRYSILTGRYTFRLRRSMEYACNFDPGQILLPEALRSAGYRTAAIGKWHNGFGTTAAVDWNAPLKPGPLEFGFDSFFGTPRTHSEPPLVFMRDHRILGWEEGDPISVDRSPGTGAHGRQVGGKKAMSMRPTDQIDLMLADEAARFIGSQAGDKPFFLYLAWVSPHNPISPSAPFRGKSGAGRYGDFIQQLDHAVGRVLDSLDKHGRSRDTLVILTSDNGGRYENAALKAGHRPNGELLGQKTDVWEGGHRVPFLARWPGKIPAGGTRKELFHQVDLMATLAEAASAKLPDGASPDGRSELRAFLNPSETPAIRTEGIFHGTRSLALRQGSWFYIPVQGSGGKTVPEPAKPWALPYRTMGMKNSDVDDRGAIKEGAPQEQLYDLATDPAQSRNLAAANPDKLKELRERFRVLTRGVKAGAKTGGE
jgi:arylsulfatase A-like enzyme